MPSFIMSDAMKITGCPFLKAQALKAQALKPNPEAKPEDGETKVPLDLVTKSVQDHKNNPALALEDLHEQFGSAFETETPGGTVRFDHTPGTARKVLMRTEGRQPEFKKSDSQTHRLAAVLGKENVLLASGDDWSTSRGALKDFFASKNMKTDAKTQSMAKVMDKHFDQIDAQIGDDGTADINIGKVMRKATLDVALTHLFSETPNDKELENLTESFESINKRVGQEWLLPAEVTGLDAPEQKFTKSAEHVRDWATGLVEKRLKAKEQPDDALTRLMGATDPTTGQPYSKNRLVSEVLNLMLAGHETTANLITWTLTDLARDPVGQSKMSREVHDIAGKNVPTMDQVKAMDSITALWKKEAAEHPPNFLIAREALTDTTIGSKEDPVDIKKGTTVLISTQHANMDTSGMFSFGGGKRFCLGMQMATVETEVAVSRFLQKFEISDTGHRGVTSGLTQNPADTEVTIKRRRP